MITFRIQPDSEIPIGTQLYDQLSFAITTRQYTPGQQLPSTRQLAISTGVHRNTVSKVYQQLQKAGLVESRSGAGVFVVDGQSAAPHLDTLQKLAKQAIDGIVKAGYGLEQIREGITAELEWRLRCTTQLLVACHAHDPGIATIMASQICRGLDIPVQVVTIESLPQLLQETTASTIVTNRYLYEATKQAATGFSIPIIPLNTYDYAKERQRVQALPAQSYVGIVSESSAVLRLATSIIRSARGQDLMIVTAMPQQQDQLYYIARYADIVFVGESVQEVQKAVAATQVDRIRSIEVVYCEKYIARESMERLKLELGMIHDFTEG